MWRGVRNCPFCPAVAIFDSMYSYKSPLVSRSCMGIVSSMSSTRDKSAGLGIVKRTSFMWCEYVDPSTPSFRRNGKISSLTMSNITPGSKPLNRDQRRSSCSAVKTGSSIGLASRLALFSASVCRSSSLRMNSR